MLDTFLKDFTHVSIPTNGNSRKLCQNCKSARCFTINARQDAQKGVTIGVVLIVIAVVLAGVVGGYFMYKAWKRRAKIERDAEESARQFTLRSLERQRTLDLLAQLRQQEEGMSPIWGHIITSEEVEKAFPRSHSTNQETTCSICLVSLSSPPNLESNQVFHRTLPCSHSFHDVCIDLWFATCKRELLCPVCRFSCQDLIISVTFNDTTTSAVLNT